MNYPSVYIILLNWNGWRDTLACVESCRKLTWPNYRLVIVDNGSTDGSEAILRERGGDVEILQTGHNLGFAGGNNVGIRHALAQGADYVWLLNNDTLVDPDALTALVLATEADPAVSMAGSKIYYHDTPNRIWCAGGMWQKGKLAVRHRGAHEEDSGQFDTTGAVGSLSGCSLLVRASAIAKIGLLQEDYFLYWEDSDWCARAQEQGSTILFVPASRIWHKISASVVNQTFSQYYYFTRNGLLFLKRHDPACLLRFLFYNLLFGLKSLATGNARVLQGFLIGILDFVRGRFGYRP
jgi:GT2 family glycosyltransferase